MPIYGHCVKSEKTCKNDEKVKNEVEKIFLKLFVAMLDSKGPQNFVLWTYPKKPKKCNFGIFWFFRVFWAHNGVLSKVGFSKKWDFLEKPRKIYILRAKITFFTSFWGKKRNFCVFSQARFTGLPGQKLRFWRFLLFLAKFCKKTAFLRFFENLKKWLFEYGVCVGFCDFYPFLRKMGLFWVFEWIFGVFCVFYGFWDALYSCKKSPGGDFFRI